MGCSESETGGFSSSDDIDSGTVAIVTNLNDWIRCCGIEKLKTLPRFGPFLDLPSLMVYLGPIVNANSFLGRNRTRVVPWIMDLTRTIIGPN